MKAPARPGQSDAIDEIASSCLMGRARLLARVLTSIYDAELRPFGLKATQLMLLVVVARKGPLRRSRVGALLHFDLSTLTRTVEVLQRNGWILERADTGGRGYALETTARGKALVKAAWPAWERAQRKARQRIGREGVDALMSISDSFLDEAL